MSTETNRSDRPSVRDLLSRDERRQLRELTWNVWRSKARRPSQIPQRDRVPVEEANEAAFVDLEVAE